MTAAPSSRPLPRCLSPAPPVPPAARAGPMSPVGAFPFLPCRPRQPGRPLGGSAPAAFPADPAVPAGPAADLRAGDNAEHDFPWGGPAQTVVDAPVRPAGEGDPIPPGPFSPGGAPGPGGIPAQARNHRPVPRPLPGSPADRGATLAASARRGLVRRAAPRCADDRAGAPAADARASAGPPGGRMRPNGLSGPAGLIDAPPWLSAPPRPGPASPGPRSSASSSPRSSRGPRRRTASARWFLPCSARPGT